MIAQLLYTYIYNLRYTFKGMNCSAINTFDLQRSGKYRTKRRIYKVKSREQCSISNVMCFLSHMQVRKHGNEVQKCLSVIFYWWHDTLCSSDSASYIADGHQQFSQCRVCMSTRTTPLVKAWRVLKMQSRPDQQRCQLVLLICQWAFTSWAAWWISGDISTNVMDAIDIADGPVSYTHLTLPTKA